jgi:hypothetical protein
VHDQCTFASAHKFADVSKDAAASPKIHLRGNYQDAGENGAASTKAKQPQPRQRQMHTGQPKYASCTNTHCVRPDGDRAFDNRHEAKFGDKRKQAWRIRQGRLASSDGL